MNEKTRLVLQDVLARYGEGLAEEPKRLEAILKDLCPANTQRDIFSLIIAAQAGVQRDLKRGIKLEPAASLIPRLAALLCESYGLSTAIATWSVESWALALKIAPPDREVSTVRAESRTEEVKNTPPKSEILEPVLVETLSPPQSPSQPEMVVTGFIYKDGKIVDVVKKSRQELNEAIHEENTKGLDRLASEHRAKESRSNTADSMAIVIKTEPKTVPPKPIAPQTRRSSPELERYLRTPKLIFLLMMTLLVAAFGFLIFVIVSPFIIENYTPDVVLPSGLCLAALLATCFWVAGYFYLFSRRS